MNGALFFQGYPDGNIVHQFCVILSLWNDIGSFPVNFVPYPSIENDETPIILDALNRSTGDVSDVFKALEEQNSASLFKEIRAMLVSLGPEGFSASIGFRRTPSSRYLIPPERDSLMESFNRRNTILSKLSHSPTS